MHAARVRSRSDLAFRHAVVVNIASAGGGEGGSPAPTPPGLDGLVLMVMEYRHACC